MNAPPLSMVIFGREPGADALKFGLALWLILVVFVAHSLLNDSRIQGRLRPSLIRHRLRFLVPLDGFAIIGDRLPLFRKWGLALQCTVPLSELALLVIRLILHVPANVKTNNLPSLRKIFFKNLAIQD